MKNIFLNKTSYFSAILFDTRISVYEVRPIVFIIPQLIDKWLDVE